MPDWEEEIHFSYGYNRILILTLPYIMVYIGLPISITGITGYLLMLILGARYTAIEWISLFVLCGGTAFLITELFCLVNEYCDIKIVPNGFRIRIFHFYHRWLFISWEDVLGIELSPVVDRKLQPVWIIKIKKLTYWHRLLSRKYKVDTQPGIIINSDMADRDRLLTIVDEHINQ